MEGVRTRSQIRETGAAGLVQRAEQQFVCDGLPVEVLTDILHRVAKEDFQDLFRAQQVCRLWRHASYAVPDIEWCINSRQAGSAMVQFLKSRLHSGAPINSVSIRLTKKGLICVPLEPIVAALAAFTVRGFKAAGPDPWCDMEGYKQRGQAGGKAVVKGSVELFKGISVLRSITVLHLEHFGDDNNQACIQEPLPAPFMFLRVLILKSCYMKRVVLEQLINSSRCLIEARLEGGHYEEEQEHQDPMSIHARPLSLLHIVSRSLEILCIDQYSSDLTQAHLKLDAPNLTSLNLDHYEYCANLKTPKLVKLLMRSVDQFLRTASLEHLVELTFHGYCQTFSPQIPEVLHRAPNLIKLCIFSRCDKMQESALINIAALLPELPRTLEHLALSWDFLRGLEMRQASTVINESVVELEVSDYYELDGKSEIRSLKRRLRLLRKALPAARRFLFTHSCPRLQYEHTNSIIDIFDGFDYIEVKGEGWMTCRDRDLDIY